MKTAPTLSFLLLVLFCWSSCSPLRIVRLEPSDDESIDRMLYGNPVQSQQLGDLTAEVSFYDATPKFVVFNLEITNNGNTPFDFDPATIQLIPGEGGIIQAIDPELQLFGMDMKEAKQLKTQRIIAGIGTGLLVVEAVAVISDDNFSNRPDNVLAVTNLAVDASDVLLFSAANNLYDSRVHYAVPREEIPFPSNRFFWLDHALRTTTIRPGETVAGKVAFRRFDKEEYVDFTLSAEQKTFTFGFYQRVFRP